MTYLKGLKPQNIVGAVLGSYGWSGEGDKQARAIMEEMKIPLIADNVRCLYVPTSEKLQECFDLGTKMAEEVIKICE
jgi:flavorubredoxin